MKNYKAQFEAAPEGNILWFETESSRIIATIEIPEICSEDFGYLNLKEMMQIFLEVYDPRLTSEVAYPYDGKEHLLNPDAYIMGAIISIEKR